MSGRGAPLPTCLLVGAGLAGIAAIIGVGTGHRVLIVRSGSMAPAIATGDAVVSRATTPDEVREGDVITFRDPSRADRLLTHRVQAVLLGPHTVEFTTRGDANTGVERWSTQADGLIGKVVIRLPNAGYALAALSAPWLRASLVLVAMLLLASSALTRIWGR